MSTSFAVLGPKQKPFWLSDYHIIMRYLNRTSYYLINESVNNKLFMKYDVWDLTAFDLFDHIARISTFGDLINLKHVTSY